MNTQHQSQSTEPQHRTKPTHEEIAECAYLIWEKEGCPEGRDMDHWCQAELQLAAIHTLGIAHD